MKIAVIYESKTGNTKVIAEAISDVCKTDNNLLLESVEEALKNKKEYNDIDIYFLGSWTDKGTCGDQMKQFCSNMKNQNVALFGTAGFGGSKEYYASLAKKFSEVLHESNTILGTFYCQGGMPMVVRNRYTSILEKDPDDKKIISSIENFDTAMGHPDIKDLEKAKKFAKTIFERVQ